MAEGLRYASLDVGGKRNVRDLMYASRERKVIASGVITLGTAKGLDQTNQFSIYLLTSKPYVQSLFTGEHLVFTKDLVQSHYLEHRT